MRRGLYTGSKCKRFDYAEDTFQRMCIAVKEEDDNDIIATIIPEGRISSVNIEEYKDNTTIDYRRISRSSRKKKTSIIKGVARKVKSAYQKSAGAVSDTINKNKDSKENSFKKTFSNYIKNAVACIKADKNRSKVALGGSVGIIAIALVVVLVNFSVGFEAIVNGQSVGIVTSKRACEQIIEEVNTTLCDNFGEESKIDADVVAIPRLVSKKSFTSEHDVKNAICSLSDKMHQMYVIYLDDVQLCALASADEAQSVLDAFKNYYTGGKENVTFSTDRPLTVVTEHAPITLLRGVAEATDILKGSEKKENEYTVQPGDNLWSISRRFDTSVDEILALNQGLSEDIVDGDVITIKSYVPVVTVTTTETKEYTEPIGYETEIVETDSMYRGKSEITRKGENGELAVVANVTKQNGYEIEREILSETTIKEPVTQIKKVGTKKPPSGYGTGSFVSPVSGTITSRYGYRRSGFHKGIDIANSYGTPIRAADNGVVIFAGWDGLFGKLVKIDHRNGYVTYYAHNSSFAVKSGDIVQKGEVIAYMGSTGNSTGNHCHFEIYKDGVLKNPSNYI